MDIKEAKVFLKEDYFEIVKNLRKGLILCIYDDIHGVFVSFKHKGYVNIWDVYRSRTKDFHNRDKIASIGLKDVIIQCALLRIED